MAVAETAFGGVVARREHFRCVPEIIQSPDRELELRLIVAALDDKHQFQLQSGEGKGGVGEAVVFATLGNPAFDGMTWRSVLCFLSGAAPKPGSHREFPIGGGMLRLNRTFEGVRLTALDFRLEVGRPFII
jgi:hypothetical protein